MLEVRELKLLRAIEAHRTLTGASRVLGLSQSALSRQLLALEDALGCALFLREHRALVPTDAGRELTESARSLLAAIESAEERVRAPRPQPPLRLATECYTCYRWLPRLLRSLGGGASEQRIAIDLDATRDPAGALLRGAIDLALVSAPRRDRRLESLEVFDDELFLITAPGHPLAGRRSVEARDLAGEALFIYDAPFEESLVARRVFRPARVRPARVHRIPFTESMIELVASGLGVAALAGWAVAPHVAAGQVARIRLTRRGLRRRWHVMFRSNAGEEIKGVASLIRAAVRPPPAA